MPTQTNFSGGGGGGALRWDTLFHGLRQGQPWACFVLIALAVAATVALWAGTNVMKKDTRR